MIASFFDILPDVAGKETRILTVQTGSNEIPAGDYGLIEFFCAVPTCDCRRVSLQVVRPRETKAEAVIGHAFVGGDFGPDGKRTYLDPLHYQADYAPALLEFVVDMLATDKDYAERLERHYELTKQAVADPKHPCHKRLEGAPPLSQDEPGSQLRPGTIGTAKNPVMLRVPNTAMAQRVAETAVDMGVHYMIEIAPGKTPDFSDLDRIGQPRGVVAGMSRHERRAMAKRERSGRR